MAILLSIGLIFLAHKHRDILDKKTGCFNLIPAVSGKFRFFDIKKVKITPTITI